MREHRVHHFGSLRKSLGRTQSPAAPGASQTSITTPLGTRLLGREYSVVDADGQEPPLPEDLSRWLDLYPEWK